MVRKPIYPSITRKTNLYRQILGSLAPKTTLFDFSPQRKCLQFCYSLCDSYNRLWAPLIQPALNAMLAAIFNPSLHGSFWTLHTSVYAGYTLGFSMAHVKFYVKSSCVCVFCSSIKLGEWPPCHGQTTCKLWVWVCAPPSTGDNALKSSPNGCINLTKSQGYCQNIDFHIKWWELVELLNI